MDKLIGRDKEYEELKRCLHSDRSELVILMAQLSWFRWNNCPWNAFGISFADSLHSFPRSIRSCPISILRWANIPGNQCCSRIPKSWTVATREDGLHAMTESYSYGISLRFPWLRTISMPSPQVNLWKPDCRKLHTPQTMSLMQGITMSWRYKKRVK